MDKSKPVAFSQAAREFFGIHKEGEHAGLRGFMGEIKALNPTDRADLQAGLEAEGFQIAA